MRHSANFFIAVFTGTAIFLFSCSSREEKSDPPAQLLQQEQPEITKPGTGQKMEVQTFEVTGETGKKAGWGYDLYVDGNRVIHQETMQAVQGIHYFKSEEEARKVGTYAMNKMKNSGDFPTISIEELDSLGVTK
jgi:hypothetical protein